MNQDRIILHSDLDSFYASVEIMLNPSLNGRPVAVCGSASDRHGIVLARSEKAKRAGIKTGMVYWEAQQKCPDLIFVPPQYAQYLKYSRLTQQVYQRFTNKVEPYGMDECWLDLSSQYLSLDAAYPIAKKISHIIHRELGLTVSIGISYNKVFAKLGSDLDKPRGITMISPKHFQEQIWPLPIDRLLFIGPATTKKLVSFGIRNIGQLATSPQKLLQKLLGKNGIMLWLFANGLDQSPVKKIDICNPLKSIGRGTTCTVDLKNNSEVQNIILYLTQDIGHRLRIHEMKAGGVQLTIKDNNFISSQYQAQLPTPTQSFWEIAQLATNLFQNNFQWATWVRAISVRAINLKSQHLPAQLTFFDNQAQKNRLQQLETTLEIIRSRFGAQSITPASLLNNLPVPQDQNHTIIMPGIFYGLT